MTMRGILLRCAAFALVTFGAQTAAQAQLFSTGPWSGLYVGVHGGYSWDNDAAGSSITGGVGGVQAGYNLQLGQVVLGVEADYTWSQVKGSEVIAATTAVSASIDSLWSVRGRLGWVVAGNVMLYATAGYGGFDVAVNGTFSGVPFRGSAQFDGLVAGAGAELLLTRNLILRAEGLHYSSSDNALFATGDAGSATVARAALSYKF